MEIFEKKQQLRQDINESVRVVVRCRPMSEKETTSGYNSIVDCYLDRGVVEITNPTPGKDVRQPKKAFTFDAVYDGCSLQAEIYEETVRPLVSSVLNGFNGTIFAYGQTGTGKTYTMEGIRSDPLQRGIIPNSFEQIFSYISRSSNGDQYLVRASYMEIYKEEIRDLLSKDQNQKLELREKSGIGVYVKDLTSFVCKNIREIEHVMIRGNKNRKIGATNMNEHSSRSHTIFLITVETSTHTEHRKLFRVGKLNLVDLAGSEKQSKTGSRGERLREASKINLSLSALANVISALVDGKATHIPYRDSKLTRILQDSLGGNAKTIMIANIGPASYNYEESLTTLRYASRAKNIKNKPRINEDPKDALLREYQEEIQRLKDLLAKKTAKQIEAMKINADDESYFGDEASVKYGSPNKTDYDSSDDTPNKMRYDDQEHEMQKPKRDKQSMREELEKRRKQLEDDKRFSEMLEAKIHSMESRLLCGGKNIVDHTNEQQRALEQHRIEIAERKKREIEMKQQLEAQEESCLEIRGTYTNLQQEVEIKTRKLKKLFGRLQAVKQEIHDVADEFNRDRRELELAQNELLKELKAKYLIIENFIPTDEKVKLTSRLRYDEEQDAWVMTCVEKQIQECTYQRPVSGEMVRRPTSDYSRVAMHLGRHSRYRGEDILNVEMDTHVRTTSDYQGPLIAPKIQAVLEEALRDDEIIDVDAAPLNIAYSSRNRSARREKEKGHKLTKTSSSNPASTSYEVSWTSSQTKLANKEMLSKEELWTNWELFQHPISVTTTSITAGFSQGKGSGSQIAKGDTHRFSPEVEEWLAVNQSKSLSAPDLSPGMENVKCSEHLKSLLVINPYMQRSDQFYEGINYFGEECRCDKTFSSTFSEQIAYNTSEDGVPSAWEFSQRNSSQLLSQQEFVFLTIICCIIYVCRIIHILQVVAFAVISLLSN